MKKSSAICLGILLLGVHTASSGILDALCDSANVTVKPSGWAWSNVGQIVHGHWYAPDGPQTPNNVVGHKWREQLGVGSRLDATVAERCFARAAVEIGSQLNYSGLDDVDYGLRQRSWNIYVDEACGGVMLGDPADPFLQGKIGYFQYKYNPDVKNLGEYLFRTGAFPGYVLNFFDWPLSRLLGIQVSGNHTFRSGERTSSLRGDLMLTNETDFPMPPADDYSLSGVVGFNLVNTLDIGAGVQFMHLISVNDELTTPHDTTQNQYFPEGSHVKPDDRSDTVSGRKFYSSAGTKLMGRISIDPKGFFPHRIFGKEDLKLYAEAAVLGLEDYTLYQNDTTWHTIPLGQRIPVTIGLNLPAFKLLDLLSFELEYYQCPYSLEVWPVVQSGQPSGRVTDIAYWHV